MPMVRSRWEESLNVGPRFSRRYPSPTVLTASLYARSPIVWALVMRGDGNDQDFVFGRPVDDMKRALAKTSSASTA